MTTKGKASRLEFFKFLHSNKPDSVRSVWNKLSSATSDMYKLARRLDNVTKSVAEYEKWATVATFAPLVKGGSPCVEGTVSLAPFADKPLDINVVSEINIDWNGIEDDVDQAIEMAESFNNAIANWDDREW